VLLKLKDPFFESKTDFQEFCYLSQGNFTKMISLSKFILWVDGFDIESVGNVALDEVMIVADEIDKDDALFFEIVLKICCKGTREGEIWIALLDMVQEKENGE
jgi:hypothetical protein